jgi:hypothetical protein
MKNSESSLLVAALGSNKRKIVPSHKATGLFFYCTSKTLRLKATVAGSA